MGRTRYRIYQPSAPHFCTATVVDWMPLFGQPQYARIVLDSMQYLSTHARWTVHAYVLMEHHLHWIATAEDLATTIRDFKSYTARQIIDRARERRAHGLLRQLARLKNRHKANQRHQVWQEGSQPKQIQGARMLRQKLAYIHDNPVRAGYVDAPAHWRYSSARDYAGEPGLIPVEVV